MVFLFVLFFLEIIPIFLLIYSFVRFCCFYFSNIFQTLCCCFFIEYIALLFSAFKILLLYFKNTNNRMQHVCIHFFCCYLFLYFFLVLLLFLLSTKISSKDTKILPVFHIIPGLRIKARKVYLCI